MSSTLERSPLHGTPAEPLYARIRHALRAEILEGQLAPGGRLPSESELGERFGASRITVRQALAELQREGLIYTLHGKGSFVARPKAFQNVTALRGFAEQMGEMGYEVLNQLVSLEDKTADAHLAATLRLSPGDAVTEIRRVRLLNREPVSLEVTWVPQALGRRLAQADLVTRDIFLILENDCGVALGHADLTIDAVQADEASAQALRVAVGAPLLRIERLTHDSQGRPVDYEFLYFRGDTFQYRFRVDRHRS
jgi:GntR family transcriptional regulator